MKLSNLWRPVAIWTGLLVVLLVALQVLHGGSTVQGGALGAFCGATIVVVLAARERAAVKRKNPLPERYR